MLKCNLERSARARTSACTAPARQAAPKTALPREEGGRGRVDEGSRRLGRVWLWHNDDAAAAGDALTASGQSEDLAMWRVKVKWKGEGGGSGTHSHI